MSIHCKTTLVILALWLVLPLRGEADGFPHEFQAKGEAQLRQLKALGMAPEVVSAVRAYNAQPPAQAKGMTNDKWKGLSVLDPFVRSFTLNPLAEYLRRQQGDAVSEMFVSGANGCKVAFLAKTSSWSHKGKPKHEIPMSGKVWIGPMELDESSGEQQLQIGLPVLDKGKPIGSIVIGLKAASLR